MATYTKKVWKKLDNASMVNTKEKRVVKDTQFCLLMNLTKEHAMVGTFNLLQLRSCLHLIRCILGEILLTKLLQFIDLHKTLHYSDRSRNSPTRY